MQSSDDEPAVKLTLLHNTQPPVRTVMGDEKMRKALDPPDDVMLDWRMFHTLLFWTVIGDEEMRKALDPANDAMLVWRMFHTLLIWTVMGDEKM